MNLAVILSAIFTLISTTILSLAASAEKHELLPTEVFISEHQSRNIFEGGNTSGIGGDVIDRRKLTAWFYGSRPIITCFTYADNFGVTREQVKTSLSLAMLVWKKYIAEKQVSNRNAKNSINTNFQLRDSCKGEEDLRLHFGTGPIFGNIRDLKATQGLNSPVAFANKTHIAKGMAWSKGYIRLVSQAYYSTQPKPFPNWKKKNSLDAVIRHELGHVLGFDHSQGTIMDSSMISRVFLGKKKISISIDAEKQLVDCKGCKQQYNAASVSAVGKSLLTELGFDSESGLTLLQKTGKYILADGKIRQEIKFSKRIVLAEKKTLLSNFYGEKNDSRGFFDIYGHILSASGKRHSLVLNFRSGEDAVILRISRDNELVEVARFVKNKLQ